MLQTSVITSGSKGNCILVKYEDTQIIIDAGISYRYYAECMNQLGLDPKNLSGIFISHEHGDHVGGAGVIHRKTNAPIYITSPTYVYSEKKIGKMNEEPVFFVIGDYIEIENLILHPFNSPHDAVDSCNFIIHTKDNDKKQLLIATDLGYAHNLMKNKTTKATTIILESNHDVNMLKNGPYDWALKQRILSRTGHLSNKQAQELIQETINEKHDRIILAHLSEINNLPDIAFSEMKSILDKLDSKVKLHVASQYECSELFEV